MSLEIEKVPAGISRDKRAANEVKENVRSVVDTGLVPRIALVDKLAVLRIQGHLVVAEIELVADTDKPPSEAEIRMKTVCKPLLSGTAIALEGADITGLERQRVERREVAERNTDERIDDYIIAHAKDSSGIVREV